jgi:hypothetical protein
MVGECAFNMRSALDHLAYQLALQHAGGPLPRKIARATSFPIFRTGPEYRKYAPSKVQGMSRETRAAIERIQPYHRSKRPMAITLQWLDEICNVDKHRGLHPTASMLIGSQFSIRSDGPGHFVLRGIDVFPGPLAERAMLARFNGVFEGDVTFEQNIITDVVFDRDCEAPSVRGQSVLFSLAAIRDFLAADAMPELARLFPDAEFEVKVGDLK